MRSLIALVLLLSTGALMAQPEPPAPTTCSAQDASFISTFHVLVIGAAALAFVLAFFLLPRLFGFRRWWLTRAISRVLAIIGVLAPLSMCILLLPWLEAAHGFGLGGLSTLPLFQVDYRYLDCRGVEFSHQAYLWGDFAKAAPEPAIYLVIYQVVTIVVIFACAGVGTYLAHYWLVKRSISKASGRLGAIS